MTPRALSVRDYDFQPEDELFLDANIWLFIYGSQNPGDARMRIYSSAFRRILEARSRLYIDVLIVSEFINTYARLQWQIRAPDSRFKAFRNSPDFRGGRSGNSGQREARVEPLFTARKPF